MEFQKRKLCEFEVLHSKNVLASSRTLAITLLILACDSASAETQRIVCRRFKPAAPPPLRVSSVNGTPIEISYNATRDQSLEMHFRMHGRLRSECSCFCEAGISCIALRSSSFS